MAYHLKLSLAVLALSWASSSIGSASADATALDWQEATGESLALVSGDHVVWRFNFSEQQHKPYFHPLALARGPELTWDSPPDHVWHHGLWLSWKYINGINYWEIDRQTGKPPGHTQWSDVQIQRRADYSARITMNLVYGPREGDPVLRERRTLEVSAPDRQGGYHIDWSSMFTAEAEHVKLDRTPLPGEPGGKAYGGYAGLSLRLVNLDERAAMTPQGPVEFNTQDRTRLQATAMDYSGQVDGRHVGIAVLVHPESLNSPSPWYVIRSKVMTFFSPAVICNRPHEMQRGESFSLRYRIHVHRNSWSAEQISTEHHRFVNASEADDGQDQSP